MLDDTASTSGVEKLERKIYRRALSVSWVRSPVYSLRSTTDGKARLLWGISGAFFGVYAIVQDLNVPLIIQPHVLSLLSLISWAQVSVEGVTFDPVLTGMLQCQYYGNKRPRRTCVALLLGLLIVLGGLEAGMVFAIRVSYRQSIPHSTNQVLRLAVIRAR